MRKNFKHGKYVRAAVPHADIDKLIDKGTGKEDDRKGNRFRVEGSTMKFKKPKKSRGPSAGRAAPKKIKIDSNIVKTKNWPFAKGGKAGLKGKGTKDLRDKLKEITSRTWGRKGFYESAGGGEKAKPHSTREGRIAAGKRKIKRIFGGATRPKPGRPGRPLPRPGRPSPGWKRPENIMTPLRAKKGVGGIAKIIGKKAVDWIKKNRKTIRKEVYSPEGKKKTKDMLDKLKKKYPDSQMFGPDKKAKGGPVRPIDIPWPKKRVKKRHGGSAQSHYLQHGYGPTKVKLRSGKPKIAKKGW
jgi:hypothetical protein